MSPVSRKRKKGKTGRTAPRSAPEREPRSEPSECDCPACTDGPQNLVEAVFADTATLADVDDPLDAQLTAALFLAVGAEESAESEQALVEVFVPAFEGAGTPGALAFLLALASLAPRRAARSARAAADRLTTPDLLRPEATEAPAWAAVLGEPFTVSDACRLSDSDEVASILAARFERAGFVHAVAVSVDDEAGGFATRILALDHDQFAPALADIETAARSEGVEFVRQDLTSAQFRWWVERALDTRAEYDAAGFEPHPDDQDPDEFPYAALALVLRSHLATLPKPKAPAGAPWPVRDRSSQDELAVLAELADLLVATTPFRSGKRSFGQADPGRRTLPPKRTKAAGPAPIYQLKVGLRGSKPPIWRRIEVPGDIALAGLHQVLQTAFGWHDGHLHEFDTPFGRFGRPDSDPLFGSDVRAETTATLEQVAAATGAKLRYTYDFGDDWVHEIAVEKILDRAPGVAYPRCTGGRRAAPPEDCGGIWGYSELLEILANPDDAEHRDRLDWLGLVDPGQLDPEDFDAADLTAALTRRR